MMVDDGTGWKCGLEERVVLRSEVAPVGRWRRWIATDKKSGDVVLVSRRRTVVTETADFDGVRQRLAQVTRLRHPGLVRILGWGEDQFGLWVVEELGRSRPLSDTQKRLPHGDALGRGLLRVLEAIAYLHRYGLVHGRISREVLLSDGRDLKLAGVMLADEGEHGDATGEDVRAWAQLAVDMLLSTSPAFVLNEVVRDTAAGVLSSGGEIGAADLVRRIRRSARVQEAAMPTTSGAESVKEATSSGNMLKRALQFLGNLLLGVLTTVLTVGLIVGGVALGVMWFLDRLPQEVQVPNIVGMQQEEATALLEQEGLRVGRIRRVYREDIEPGAVAATLPEPGMTVREGREITLMLSLGPAQVKVPRLIGLQLDEAKDLVEKTGLVLTTGGRVRSQAPVGEIVRQEPAAGTKIARSERIVVYVSGGPKFGMVEVEGADGETVRVLFRTIQIMVPQGDPLQRVKVLEGYEDPLMVTYDRLHRPGDHIKIETYGRPGKRIEVFIEGKRVFKTQL